MFDFRKLFNAMKDSPGATALVLLVVVVFLSAPFLVVYRTLRERVPGASNVLPAK